MDQEDQVMKRDTSRVVKHNPILQGVISSMQRRKSDMDDREDLLLSTVLIPDIILATRSVHHSSFLVPPQSKSQDKISFKGRTVTPRVMEFIINFIKILIKS
jgi:hypothetical protein